MSHSALSRQVQECRLMLELQILQTNIIVIDYIYTTTPKYQQHCQQSENCLVFVENHLFHGTILTDLQLGALIRSF